MILKFWARSFLVAALFGAAMPVFAAEITSPAKQAHITDFATGKSSVQQGCRRANEAGINGKDHDRFCGVPAHC